ncbi:MAG: hypothetical protein AB1633_10410, partial [Elusimicrobiota bacterium]
MNITKIYVAILILLFMLTYLYAAGGYSENKKGGELFKDGKFDEAMEKYIAANLKLPESPVIQ